MVSFILFMICIVNTGCNKTFVEDVNGVISCNDNLDCPQVWFPKLKTEFNSIASEL